MLDIAVIGAGLRGTRHLDTISHLRDLFRLVGVCDAREERRAWAAAEYGVPVFDHPVTLLEQAKPEVVVIVVPQDAHHLVTAVAAARGCHVLSETPIGTTLGMAGHMIESCRRAGVVLEVSEQVWRFPEERLKRLIVDEGLIGDVTQVHLWYFTGSYHGTNALRRFITARPRRVLGLSREFPVARYVDLDGVEQRRQTWELGAIDFDGGAMAIYQWPVGGDTGNYWEVIGTAGTIPGRELVLFGEPQGVMSRQKRRIPIETIVEDGPDGRKSLVGARLQPGLGAPAVEWENPYRRYHLAGADDVARADVYAGLHEAITSGPPPVGDQDGWPATPPAAGRFYGAANARADQELLMALRESARRGNVWLDLPLPKDEPTAFERQLHDEFEQRYGESPFGDPERLVGKLFPRGGLQQTVHEASPRAAAS